MSLTCNSVLTEVANTSAWVKGSKPVCVAEFDYGGYMHVIKAPDKAKPHLTCDLVIEVVNMSVLAIHA